MTFSTLRLGILALLQASLVSAGLRAEAVPEVSIHAGEQDRAATLVTFPAVGHLEEGVYATQDGWPVQVDAAGNASLLLPKLAHGQSVTLKLTRVDAYDTEWTVVTAEKGTEQLTLRLGSAAAKRGKPIAVYQMTPGPVPAGMSESFAHGAHLHPVYSPLGQVLTANHPSDHPHQRGIWMSWTKTQYGEGHPDFWNMGKDKSGKLTGEVRFQKLTGHWSGPVHGGFRSEHLWLDHTTGTDRPVLTETWDIKAYPTATGKGDVPAPSNVLDLVSTQTISGNEPLKLPKYHYGGLGVRGSPQWDAVDAVKMFTSEGHDRKSGDGQKARWLWLGGEVDGGKAGIAVLMHPDNFRFPQPLRLNPKNPQICVAPSAEGDWSIEPGKPLVLKYRIVLSDTHPDAAELERLWRDYAQPPTVGWKTK